MTIKSVGMSYKIAPIIAGLFISISLAAQKSEQVKTHIALLGTYRFDNPNQDQFNVKSDNVL